MHLFKLLLYATNKIVVENTVILNVYFLNIYLFLIIIQAIYCYPWSNVFIKNKYTILCESHGCWPIQFNCACVMHLQHFILVVLCTPLKSCRMGIQRFKQLKGQQREMVFWPTKPCQSCFAAQSIYVKSCRKGLDNFKTVESFGLRCSSGFSQRSAGECFISFFLHSEVFSLV